MKVRPIIFQPEMVRALPAGRKTQTRRLRWVPAKPPKEWTSAHVYKRENPLARVEVGDVLYVRENWQTELRWEAFKPSELPKAAPFYFPTEPEVGCAGRLRPSIHLPRRASRLTLAVTGVRFEPVQNISPDDAAAEGLVYAENGDAAGFWFDDEPERAKCHGDGSIECYRELWKRINGEESWDKNPEVVALTFTVHRQNVDEFLRAGACFRETT